MVEITEVRVSLRNDDKLKAFVSITLNNSFVVRGLKIIRGNSGMVHDYRGDPIRGAFKLLAPDRTARTIGPGQRLGRDHRLVAGSAKSPCTPGRPSR